MNNYILRVCALNRVSYKILTALLLSFFLFACTEKATVKVSNLKCEFRINPEGIDCPNPRLSWEIASNEHNLKQEAYEIIVSTSLEKLSSDNGDLWYSGKIVTNNSSNIGYAGIVLESRLNCFWKVRIYTNQGTTEWSSVAKWSMAFMNKNEWKAKWTGLDKSFKGENLGSKTRLAARYFRKEFNTEKVVKDAKLYISGLGLYEAYINGDKIGNQELAPTLTDYTKSIKYNVFDVTNQLVKGSNAIGVILGNGRFFDMRGSQDNSDQPAGFGFPKMIAQLEIFYKDGSNETVISDDSWKVTANGPILANNEWDGEEYDARKEMHGWTKTGFDDNEWLKAELTSAPGGELKAQLNRNIKVMETRKPKSITKLNPGVFILDMGQNMVGRVVMSVKGNAGTTVRLRFAESLKDDGSLYMTNLRSANVSDLYILSGNGIEKWNPIFVYHGFRYVEISGYPGTPTIDDFVGEILYDEMETTGSFDSSDSTLNQIYQSAYWGIRDNYRGMPTDCPQRDERMGWLGDRAVGSLGESFIFNNHDLYVKWLDDIEQSQLENGSIPDVAPAYWRVYSDNMTWPAAYLNVANMLYEQFGDVSPIINHYKSMKKWMSYMKEKYMVDNLIPKDTYGDWCMPPESPELIHSADPARKTDGEVLGTSFYYRMLWLLGHFADIQGKTDDANAFAKEASVVKKAYNDRFFNRETSQYSNNTVTANLLSLCYNMVPEGFEEKVFENIVDKTMTEFDGHVSTGLVGIQWLMRGLSDYGRADLAFKIATNRDYPSWGYMIENGATTIWELWNGNTADPAMNSQNHVMLLGDLIVWYYEYLAGIKNAEESAGFEHITMKPYPVDGLSYVNASFNSVRGKIVSNWKKEDKSFEWRISIPGNSTATVYIPYTNGQVLTEGGKDISTLDYIQNIKKEDNFMICELGSGDYNFVVK